MNPLLSIIVPTLNEEKVIAGTLEGLKRLKLLEHEIIVSDDKSKDKTSEIAKQYADKVIQSEDATKRSIARGRNRGAKAASGDYFVFVDADVNIPDIDNFFARALKTFKEDSRLVALTGIVKVSPEKATFADNIFFGLLNLMQYVSNNFLGLGIAPGEFQMIKRAAFEKVGGYNENLAASEDYDLFSRLSRLGRTKVKWNLKVFHSGRRAHAIGWPKLLKLWMGNAISNALFKRSMSKKWEEVR